MKTIFGQSSLIPLSKIANAPTKSIRLLWIVFSTTMLAGLLSCIGLVVKQYSQQQTIFQLDFSGTSVNLDSCPSISVCFDQDQMGLMFEQAIRHWLKPVPKEFIVNTTSAKQKKKQSHGSSNQKRAGSPWFDPIIAPQLYKKVLEPDANLSVLSYEVPADTSSGEQFVWRSHLARSRLYPTLHNFSVRFALLPDFKKKEELTLRVLEQVPHVKSFLCTTFEFLIKHPSSYWSSVTVTVHNENDTEISSRKHLYGYKLTFITHDRGSMPFSAYDRHITQTIPAGTKRSVFMSKSITQRLDTKRNPCQAQGSKLLLFGYRYEYGHDACGWQKCCQNTRIRYNCTCQVDVLRDTKGLCSSRQQKMACPAQVSYQQCPASCTVAKFEKHNIIDEPLPIMDNALHLVKSDNVHVATEEELYTLTKLCSEIGGLCSLFIGFSCIFVFELFEAVILWRRRAIYLEGRHRSNGGLAGKGVVGGSNMNCLPNSGIGFSHTLDVTNSPQMGHFLTSLNLNNIHFSKDEVQAETPQPVTPSIADSKDCFRNTVVLTLCSESGNVIEYCFYGNKDVDKELMTKSFQQGTAKIKLL